MSDLVAYRQNDEAEQKAVLDELAEEAQKLGLGYRRGSPGVPGCHELGEPVDGP